MEVTNNKGPKNAAAPPRGRLVNMGNGTTFQVINIGHPEYAAVIDTDTAFWSLVRRGKLADVLSESDPSGTYAQKAEQFAEEMNDLRFGITPYAVYFNPVERCNINCTYCYIPEKMRRDGEHMSTEKLFKTLDILKRYFRATLPDGSTPQIIFHGAEPLLNRDAIFADIDEYGKDFLFGVQTNATLLDDATIKFLTGRDVSIGISLDAPTAEVADCTRKNGTAKAPSGR